MEGEETAKRYLDAIDIAHELTASMLVCTSLISQHFLVGGEGPRRDYCQLSVVRGKGVLFFCGVADKLPILQKITPLPEKKF